MTLTPSNPGLWPKMLRMPLIRLVIGILAVLVPVAVVQLLIASFVAERLLRNIFLGVLTPPVAIWSYSKFVRLAEQREATELSLRGALKDIGMGLLLGTLLLLGTIGILAAAGAYSLVGLNGWQVILAPLIGMVASAVFEEILFRGVLFRILEQFLGSWWGLGISAAIFGGLHMLNANATVVGAISVMLTAGLLLPTAYMLTRRLWLPIGIHYAWNFLQSGIFGLAVSGNEARPGLVQSSIHGPEWLTGGGFGIEASVVPLLLSIPVVLYLLNRAGKLGNIRPSSMGRASAHAPSAAAK